MNFSGAGVSLFISTRKAASASACVGGLTMPLTDIYASFPPATTVSFAPPIFFEISENFSPTVVFCATLPPFFAPVPCNPPLPKISLYAICIPMLAPMPIATIAAAFANVFFRFSARYSSIIFPYSSSTCASASRSNRSCRSLSAASFFASVFTFRSHSASMPFPAACPAVMPPNPRANRHAPDAKGPAAARPVTGNNTPTPVSARLETAARVTFPCRIHQLRPFFQSAWSFGGQFSAERFCNSSRSLTTNRSNPSRRHCASSWFFCSSVHADTSSGRFISLHNVACSAITWAFTASALACWYSAFASSTSNIP